MTNVNPAAPDTTYDVFISYSHKDAAWVKGELLKRIEAAGLRAFVDYRDFTRGAPSIKEMERGVIECRKTLLVLTPDYIASEWAEIEVRMGQTLSPANRDFRLIPLLKTHCDKPLSIASLTHVDFTDGADRDLAWRQLLTALGAAPEPVQPESPSRDHWFLAHPYAMPPNFTGRVAERRMLTEWLNRDEANPLLVLRALGGFGKSALTWHWLLHDVDPGEYSRVVWWSFYEGDASFESFVAETVRYLDPNSTPSASAREQLAFLLRALHSRGTLLILDGFERSLRAFGGLNAAYQGETVGTEGGERDCISPLTDAFLRNMASLPGMLGKVLVTTRLRPAAVETRGGILLQGCCEEELVQLHPADAVRFFHAQGIRGGRAEVEGACEPYGYHPLSLRLLAGLIVRDIQQPGDIAAAQRLDVSGDLVQRQHHVLEQAYSSLDASRQELLSRIACFRGPVSYDALKALAKTKSGHHKTGLASLRILVKKPNQSSLDADLHDLITRGLLHRDLVGSRFDLHPIVRRYAYDRLNEMDRAGAHAHLRDYFAAVPEPDKVHSLDDLAPTIELYHHSVRAGRYEEAFTVLRDRLVPDPLHFQFGAYQLMIELKLALFSNGEDRPPQLNDENDQSWILTALAYSYSFSGQPRRAVPLFKRSIAIDEKFGSLVDVAIALGALGSVALLPIGSLRESEASARRRIALCLEIKDEFQEAVGHQDLGCLLAFRGAWSESDLELAKALEIFEKQGEVQAQTTVWINQALRELLHLRSAPSENKSEIGGLKRNAIDFSRRALELTDQQACIGRAHERDYIRAHWLLGAAYEVAGEFDQAESHLHEALDRCRRINMVDHEANILIALARLRMATAVPDEAQRLAEEAIVITERSGYVLQGTDAHLVLAQLAKDRDDAKLLREHAAEALRLATCDGPPDYTYKAAYDEASALLR